MLFFFFLVHPILCRHLSSSPGSTHSGNISTRVIFYTPKQWTLVVRHQQPNVEMLNVFTFNITNILAREAFWVFIWRAALVSPCCPGDSAQVNVKWIVRLGAPLPRWLIDPSVNTTAGKIHKACKCYLNIRLWVCVLTHACEALKGVTQYMYDVNIHEWLLLHGWERQVPLKDKKDEKCPTKRRFRWNSTLRTLVYLSLS